MKLRHLPALLLFIVVDCAAQEKVSAKKFDDITLVNQITFTNAKFDQPRFCCAFLLKYQDKIYAITAKHLLKIIKPDDMNNVSISNVVTSWKLYPLTKKEELVNTGELLNQDQAALLSEKETFDQDWLVFSVKQNLAQVKVLQARTTAVIPGEKLYVIGWTRKMESGAQRVYEFEYYKTVNNRLLLKDLIVPELFGGLSGAPVVDEQGLVVGLVSNSTTDPATGKKYFSPCPIDGLLAFLKDRK